jgi:hypothetical protein
LVVTIVPIPELSEKLVQFVSVRLEGEALSEFDKFDEKEFPEPHHQEELQIIYSTIRQISKRGAKTYYFRHEGPAFALPGKVDQEQMDANPDDYGLRLYCGILAPDLVLLLNGDIKTEQDPRQCPNVGPHFRLALRIVRALMKAWEDGFIRFTDGKVDIDDEYEIEI